MPGVVAMSGIVPAAMSLPLPFSTGLKYPGGGAHDLWSEQFGNPKPLKDRCKGLSRFNAVENDHVGTKQSPFEIFNGRYVIRGAVYAVPKANADVTDHRSIPDRTLPELVSASTKSGSTTTTSATSPSSIFFFMTGPALHAKVT